MQFGQFDPFESLLWYVVFLLSTTLHEAAHAWAAMKGGDLTAYAGGQVSLDPTPHMRREPFGMVVLPLISLLLRGWPFGFASTPYDPYWADANPKKASLMALAGPMANLFLVGVSAVVIWCGIYFDVFDNPGTITKSAVVVATGDGVWVPVAMLASMMFSLNLILVVLNLIPFPPLDGSSILGLLLSDHAERRWRDFVGRPGYGIIGLLLAWYIFGPIFEVVFHLALKVLYPWASYGW